jgi:hypothetical protein
VIENLRASARKASPSGHDASRVNHHNSAKGGAPAAVTNGVRRLSCSTLLVAESVDALVQRGLVTDSKRPNPKQRKKMKGKAMGGGKTN